MEMGIWGNFGVDLGEGIGVYGGENALWTLLHHRKMTKNDEKSARYDNF